MTHRLISTIGFGILGSDPYTAIYLLSLGLRREKKSKITLFLLSFSVISILGGVILTLIFGEAAAVFLKNIMPEDNSPFWAILKFSISVLILVWVCRKILKSRKNKRKSPKTVEGNSFKYITAGIVFAITTFTDPTMYAVILIAGESGNNVTAIVLLTIWFVVSQFMAIIVYIAIQLNALEKLISFIDTMKSKNQKAINTAKFFFSLTLVCIAILLIVDTGFYLFNGRYLI